MFIKILIEDDLAERKKLSNILFNKILKNIVPIRKSRSCKRCKDKKNKYPINKRKSF